MKVTALVDRFGSNRMNADKPAELLKGCTCINVPFAGSLCEVAWFEANIINVNDLDRHVMNLAAVVRDSRQELQAKLDATPFHPDVLAKAQEYCRRRENDRQHIWEGMYFEWAYHYFVASWMTRGGKMGTKGEFDQGLSVRWKSGGGDSVVRFRSATESLAEWQKVMQRCTFHTLDAFDFLAECKKVVKGEPRDINANGIYCDAPWPQDGARYTHRFPESMQRRLAKVLAEFEHTRIVVRYGDHPLIRELYPAPRWKWHPLTSRTQANEAKAEVLITNF